MAPLPRLLEESKPCEKQVMAVVAQLARQLAPVVDVLYPPRCPACGIAIARQAGLCGECWSTLEVPAVAMTDDAGIPVYAASLYGDTSRKLVLAFKHGGRIALAKLLARLIAARLPVVSAGADPPLLVPVPLHPWRLWSRGFNQAALLAKELERLGKGEALVDGLRRNRRTPSLGGLGRAARERVLRGAITLHPAKAKRLAGRHVILVDDVLTSGATSRACLAAMAAAQPLSLSVACFALVENADGFERQTKEKASPKNITPEAF